MPLALRFLGHDPGASLGYFTGARVTLTPVQIFALPPGGLMLGRRVSADLRVASSEVAGHHCRITPTGDETVSVEDLGSTNGTRIEGRRIDRGEASVGQRISVAGFHFELIAQA